MSGIYIEHNPFTVETKFLIDGQKPDDNSPFANYTNRRLQEWIEGFFQDLYKMYNSSENSFNVTFKGMQADCIDMEEAVKNANEVGLNVQLTCEQIAGVEKRLEEISKLAKEAKTHPLFSEYFQDSKLEESINDALDKNFDVYVVATMSSGKSTVINAMLGCELLPALNEATTATIAQIFDNDQMEKGIFNIKRVGNDNEILESETLDLTTKETAENSSAIMKSWNSQDDTACIHIDGKIAGIKERDDVRLVLTDTPGPNNSQNDEHAQTTYEFITNSDRYPLILYVLNGQQLGIDDDQRLLHEIAKVMQKDGKQNKDRFIFVVNKADVFDPEKGEVIDGVVDRAKKYLHANGIENPLVYPVSALLTLLWRKRELDHDLLTRTERNNLTSMEDLFTEEAVMDLTQYMPLTRQTIEKLEQAKLPTALHRSGLPAVELSIDTYIEKYSLPNKVTRANRVLTDIIEQSTNVAETQKALDVNEKELIKLQETLKQLKTQQKQGAKTKGYIAQLKSEQKGLSETAMQNFVQQEAEIRKKLGEFGANFSGQGSEDKAKKRLNDLAENVKYEYNKMVVDLDRIITTSQDDILAELTADYKKYVAEVFADVEALDLPILSGLKQQVANFSFRLNDDEISVDYKKVKVGTRTVKTSKWYKPWTWGDTGEEAIYETREEKYVDLSELWENRSRQIRDEFFFLIEDAQQKAVVNSENMLEKYLLFMGSQFESKFEKLLSEVESMTQDADKRKVAIESAKENLVEIKSFTQRIESILAF